MQLYTINATPWREDIKLKHNNDNMQVYPYKVSHALSSVGIDGFTIQEVQGYWQGIPEKSYAITVAHTNSDDIDKIAEILRDMYNQDAVMITYPDNSVKFIER